MTTTRKFGAQPHRGNQALSAAELGAKDGARLAKQALCQPSRELVKRKAAEAHTRHVKTGRLTPFDVVAYCQAFMSAFVVLLVLSGCAGSAEPAPMPADCSVATEKVRLQLCPDWKEAVECADVATTNPDIYRCAGFGPQQHTGNTWCCDWAADSEAK